MLQIASSQEHFSLSNILEQLFKHQSPYDMDMLYMHDNYYFNSILLSSKQYKK